MYKWWVFFVLVLTFFGCVVDTNEPFGEPNGSLDWPSSDPGRYHWDGYQDPYFEGWYFKINLPDPDESFFIIYGVVNPGYLGKAQRYSFLYLMKGSTGEQIFERYGLDQFNASKHELEIQIGDNSATLYNLQGFASEDGSTANWNINIEMDSSWANSMGSLTNVPYLPVNWNVFILNGKTKGSLIWNGKQFNLEGATIYGDHNWGPQFPSAWAFICANRFSNPKSALAAAGGPNSFLGTASVNAFMLVIDHGDDRYEFRMQDLNTSFTMNATPEFGTITLSAVQGDIKVDVLAEAPVSTFYDVLGPSGTQGMEFLAKHSLVGQIRYTIYKMIQNQWEVLGYDSSSSAAVEFGGSLRSGE